MSALCLSGCAADAGLNEQGVQGDIVSSGNYVAGEYTSVLSGEILDAASNVKTHEVDYAKAVYVTLGGDKATVTAIGNAHEEKEISNEAFYGLRLSGGTLLIESAGDYVLTGEFYGQVQINATVADKVHLVLDGVSITCENSSAIYGKQSDRIYITLAEGSTNMVSDGASYIYETEEEDEPNAVIFSKDDLTFDGAGTLVVCGNFADGIRSKDDLAIVDGAYEVTAIKDAIQGKDSVCITGGNFILKSGGDAIKASNDTDENKGYVVIDGGTFSLQADDDGVHGESGLLIQDCKMDILSCYEGLEAKTIEMNGGEIEIVASDDGINAAYSTSEENCNIGITGGKLTITAGGDGIDSNGNLYMVGGEVYVNGAARGADSALDCSVEAVVSGGTMVALGTSEMAMGFSENSSQCFIFYNMEKQAAKGDVLQLLDKNGNVLLTYSSVNAYNSVLISSPALVADGTYTIICGEQEAEIALSGTFYSQGGFRGHGNFGGGPGDFGGRPGDFKGDFDGDFDGKGRWPGERDTGEIQDMPEGMTPPEGWSPGQMPQKR